MAQVISQRKVQINQVAQSLFNDKGYSATSMRDLAKEVGIEPASLYNHYKSKEEILSSICFDIADQFFEAMKEISPGSQNACELLKIVMRKHIDVIVKNLDASRVFFLEWKHLNGEPLEDFKLMRKRYEKIFIDIINMGIESGDFRNVNVKITVFTVLSALNAIYDLYKPYGKLKSDEIADNIYSIVSSGIVNN